MDHHWRVLREEGPKLATRLGLTKEHVSYYVEVQVWLTDLQWGKSLMPRCPHCKKFGQPHGFQHNHFGRIVVDQKDHYYIISRRYKCEACKKRKEDLVTQAHHVASQMGAEIEVKKMNFQYTYMAWDMRILHLYADGRGAEFPAFLTKKAGVDVSLIDLMRPLCDKGVRPKAMSQTLLELQTKEFTKRHIRYERDYKMRKRLESNLVLPSFGEFADKHRYNGRVPTGRYLAHVYKLYHNGIREFLDKDVKKRGVEIILGCVLQGMQAPMPASR